MHDLAFYLHAFAQDDLIYFFLPVFLLGLLVEFLIAKGANLDLFESKDTKASMWMMLFVGITDIAPKLCALVAFFLLYQISPLADIIQRQWWAWLVLFFLDDLTYYLFHRSNHEIRLFWAGHVSHHSAIRMNFATALRQGVCERFHKYLFWLPLPLMGFDPLMIFTVMSINLFYQFWLHTALINKLPTWIEWSFNTPSHHRVHHASNPRYLDRNHAGVLIIWDRLFGTFAQEERNDPPVYGLTKNISSYKPLDVVLHEYIAIAEDVKRADRWQDKLKYLFYAPGWSHDGTDKRSNVIRKAFLKAER